MSPASHGSLSLRLSAFDILWALVTPPLALWIRGAPVLSANDWPDALIYSAISCGAALVAFVMFRVRDGMTPLFAVHDAIAVTKSVLVSELVTCLVLFSATRLDGVPRTTPLIHALLLVAGLIIARAWLRMRSAETSPLAPGHTATTTTEHVIVIGSNRLSSLTIELLHACAPGRSRAIAVLDDNPDMIGRSVAGVRVLGSTLDLAPVIEEFKEHGILTDRIMIGSDPDSLPAETIADIRRLAAQGDIKLDFMPRLLGLNPEPAAAVTMPATQPASFYFSIRRGLDLVLVSLLIVALLPLFAIVALIVLFDVGSPMLFWQRRIGMNGRPFQMHKFRTMKPSYDWRGLPVPLHDRVSYVGQLLRKLRLDELPQLLNVLVGDMALIGPRPLLPQDQPANPALRLSVRPGITGLAQVCGGTLLSSAEKNDFDEYYIRHAGPTLDLKILARTGLVVVTGERRDQSPLAAPPIAQG